MGGSGSTNGGAASARSAAGIASAYGGNKTSTGVAGVTGTTTAGANGASLTGVRQVGEVYRTY